MKQLKLFGKTVDIRIQCSRNFGDHAKKAADMMKEWHGKKVHPRVVLDDEVTNNFEVVVVREQNNIEVLAQGKAKKYLVHSKATKNHKLFHEESQKHLDTVRRAIQDVLDGNEPTLAEDGQQDWAATANVEPPKLGLQVSRSMESIAEEAKAAKARFDAEQYEKSPEGIAAKAAKARLEEEMAAGKARLEAEAAEKQKADEAARTIAEEAKKKKKKIQEAAAAKQKAKAKAAKQKSKESVNSTESEAVKESKEANVEAKEAESAISKEAKEAQEADVQTKAIDPEILEAARQRKIEAKQAEEEAEERRFAAALLQMDQEVNANAMKRAAAKQQVQKVLESNFFGFTCCRVSKLDDIGSEEPTVTVDNDTPLHK